MFNTQLMLMIIFFVCICICGGSDGVEGNNSLRLVDFVQKNFFGLICMCQPCLYA